MGLAWSTWLYKKKVRPFDEVLRRRLCEMAATYVRYGYRRLTVLLRREGWKVNAKRIYRLYAEERLIVRTKQRRKIGRRQRVAAAAASGRNECWSMDFMSDKLANGRAFRIFTAVDQFTRECVCLEADRAMTGKQVVQALEKARAERGSLPNSITLDNGANSRVGRWRPGQSNMVCSCASFGRGGRWRTASSKVSMVGLGMNV
jgi:putative transposase